MTEHTLSSELQSLDREIQSVMNHSRVLLEEMTNLLYRNSSRGDRRTMDDRRTSFDRRSGRDRRAEADRQYAALHQRPEDNPYYKQRSGSDRRDSDRRHDGRRLSLEDRKKLITREMDTLAQRNVFLLSRKRTLLSARAVSAS